MNKKFLREEEFYAYTMHDDGQIPLPTDDDCPPEPYFPPKYDISPEDPDEQSLWDSYCKEHSIPPASEIQEERVQHEPKQEGKPDLTALFNAYNGNSEEEVEEFRKSAEKENEKFQTLTELFNEAVKEAEKVPDEDDGIPNREKLNEKQYCLLYQFKHPMKNIDGVLYDVNGRVDPKLVKREIMADVSKIWSCNLAKKVKDVYDAMMIINTEEDLPLETDKLHVKNGTYYLESGEFKPQKFICRNRLAVDYNPSCPAPAKFMEFMSQLFHEEDIPTVQEYLGYCMIPTTKAQKMMILVGNGGEGKSVLAYVLRSIFGDGMNVSSIKKLASSRFSKADQAGMLLMVDDDMSLDALPDTEVLKSMITARGKSEAERKGRQSEQVEFYVRFLGLTNGNLTSLYDKSEGFYRRQLVIRCKDRPKDRIDDAELADKLTAEAEGIFLWALQGLKRLIMNHYVFTVSDKSAKLMQEAKRSDNNIISFLEDRQFIRFEKGRSETSRRLYAAYQTWCEENLEKPMSMKTFSGHLYNHASNLGIEASTNVAAGNERRARGFRNICIMISDFSL
ncbi:MAG: phage/plasmid primase, P4 family [Clostridia bacterium]|nr:phage/plasmid primase, P4 family [Clostridia bacterium]